MPRGQASTIGDERTAANGYHYTKTPDRGWVLTHWLTAEKARGGVPIDNEHEMVQFVEPKFKKDPKNPKGVRIIKKNTASLRKRKATIEARIDDLNAELVRINKQLKL